MTFRRRTFAALATATILSTQALALPALSVSATRLTKSSAAAYARKDAQAAAVISPGDKVRISGCHAISRTTFKCKVLILPVASGSRCRWTDTIKLVHGKPSITYSRATCTN